MQYVAIGWVAAWSGVIKYHGPRPMPRPGCIWVANHSSMIDYTILTAYMPFAAIMQLQPGWVGLLQKHVLSCLGCLWFHRTEVCTPSVPPGSPPWSAYGPCALQHSLRAPSATAPCMFRQRPRQPAASIPGGLLLASLKMHVAAVATPAQRA